MSSNKSLFNFFVASLLLSAMGRGSKRKGISRLQHLHQ